MEDLSDWRWTGRKQLRRWGHFLLYSQVRPHRNYKRSADLFVYDLKEEREIQLTNGWAGHGRGLFA